MPVYHLKSLSECHEEDESAGSPILGSSCISNRQLSPTSLKLCISRLKQSRRTNGLRTSIYDPWGNEVGFLRFFASITSMRQKQTTKGTSSLIRVGLREEAFSIYNN